MTFQFSAVFFPDAYHRILNIGSYVFVCTTRAFKWVVEQIYFNSFIAFPAKAGEVVNPVKDDAPQLF